MIKRLKKHTISFKNAFNGLLWSYRTQPNFRLHITISLIVLFLGIFFNVSQSEWLVIVLTISTGLVIESINTAIEATTDAITKEWRKEIKIAKDVAASAMLTHAIGSIIIAGMIFLPKMM